MDFAGPTHAAQLEVWAVYPAAQLLSLAEQELLGQQGDLEAWRRAAAMEA